MTFMTCLRDPGERWAFSSLLMYKDKIRKKKNNNYYRAPVENNYMLKLLCDLDMGKCGQTWEKEVAQAAFFSPKYALWYVSSGFSG